MRYEKRTHTALLGQATAMVFRAFFELGSPRPKPRVKTGYPLSVLSAWLVLVLPATAQSPDARGLALFNESIEPLLREHCYKCHSHSADAVKGGLVLDSRSGWAEGGVSGPAIVPGKPAESLLWEAVSYTDPDFGMPPKGKKMPADAIDKFREWIALGAPDPRTDVAQSKMEKEQRARKHWAYQPLRLAPVEGQDGQVIDSYIQARLDAEGLHATAEADRPTLLRRVFFDLTGLPPAPDEIAAFIADRRPDAFARAVDHLLDSPGFGERWARAWLDLAGYADTVDSAQMPMPDAWRYRDYVVSSFNADKPLDRFITEQLAGDLLPAENDAKRREQLIALGFLAIGPWSLSEQDKEQLRMDIVDHQIMRVGRIFLGMTLDCARCHDHKFDPVSLNDYYGLAGIFGSTDTLADWLWRSNLSKPLDVPLPETPEERALREAAIGPHRQKETEAAQTLTKLKVDLADSERELAACEGGKCETHAAVVADAKKAVDKQDKVVRLLEFHRPAPPHASAVRERPEPADCRINIRGNVKSLGPAVPRGFLSVLKVTRPEIPERQSGRLQLAQWLTAADQPLTLRVLANRVWHHLFGAGLVGSVDYFGARGDQPTHPELLDYLANRLREQQWSLKKFIREIVLTRAYQRSSAHDALAATRDPENKLLWRANRRRLDAEMIRDAILASSGALSMKRGGDALELQTEGNLSGGDLVNPPTVKTSKPSPENLTRRTLYMPIFRRDQIREADVLNLFDFPSPAEPTGARRATAVPTQSLFLLNSPFIKEQAELLAKRVQAASDSDAAILDQLWLRVCSRPPSSEERAIVEASLRELLGEAPSTEEKNKAWVQVAQGLFGSSAFLFRL